MLLLKMEFAIFTKEHFQIFEKFMAFRFVLAFVMLTTAACVISRQLISSETSN